MAKNPFAAFAASRLRRGPGASAPFILFFALLYLMRGVKRLWRNSNPRRKSLFRRRL